MTASPLIEFLANKMSMTEVYQPVIIRHLLGCGGTATKAELAAALAAHDVAVQEYYQQITMRWPKITLSKHGVIDYQRKGSLFTLLSQPKSEQERKAAIQLCDTKIAEWIDRRKNREQAPEAGASVRYQILKDAGGRCALCGIHSSIKPIDIDHIVPRAKANKQGKVTLDDRLIDLNDPANLQALCFSCNRAKRDQDQTDFRRTKKLVRDKIPDMIRAEGRTPVVKTLTGNKLTAALKDKLTEEHAEFLDAKTPQDKQDELADMVEVIIALAETAGLSEDALLALVHAKRTKRGGFSDGLWYEGDEAQ
ncbi:MAG: hypothetical protein Alpg2KO_01030 [Alphaproteobacteria bacterium]